MARGGCSRFLVACPAGGILPLFLLLFLLLGGLYFRETPLLETPDEPSHISLVKYIADTGRLPPELASPPERGAPVPTIAPGPPRYYAPPLYSPMMWAGPCPTMQ